MSLTLQPLLRHRYRRETWTTILLDLFPEGAVSILAAPAEIEVTHEQVAATRQLGHIRLADGSRIALVEVEARSTVKLARNRIALRNFIGQLIVPGSSDAVLAVFHQPGKEDWRLTYASRRTTLDPETFAVTHSETAPRRFTFLLGPGETCRTAAGRLKELEGKEKLTLDDIERAFSVERLNKDFFKRYREFYERFTTHLLSSDKAAATRAAFGIAVLADAKEQEKADKPVRDFAKKLLGRLVFLHFLQKKRWLGCPAGSTDWTGGEADFIAAFFEKARAAGEGDRFHSKYLTPLFFQALNTPDRKGDIFPLTGSRLPYLNGGLFEEDAPDLRALDFPPLLFEELLGFFAEYHFTVDENDPEDHEVGIDPEMLGHIFENLLEDNKDKGAFYTPKVIVQYMARESLLHYLETHLGPDPEIGILLAEKDLTRLAKDGFVRQHAKKIATLLEDVKICDPAIGSGAFPIGLLQEILWTRLTLNWELNTPEDRARLKREIIRNSIHGVDLDPGAVEIARLRFWLALVVDEEIPRPLPNLDYKIHRADSLVEYIRGEPAHLGDVNTTGGMMKAAVDDLIVAKQALFNAHRLPEKRTARLALYRALASLAQLEFTRMRNDEGLFGTDPVRTAQLDRGVKEFGQRIREIDGVKKEKAAMQDSCLVRLQDWFDDPERATFLWHLHFGEVFSRGGFDIVVANPPYVRHETISGIAPLLRERFKVAASRADLLIFFYEQSVNLLRDGGTLTFITSNKYFRAAYGAKLRPFLSKSLALHSLIDFGDAPVFDAIAYASILIGTKGEAAPGHHLRAYTWQPADAIVQVAQILDRNGIDLAQTDLADDGWRLENAASIRLLEKLRKAGTPIDEYVGGKFFWGVRTGLNEAFVLTSEQKNQLIAEDPKSAELIKPYLRGRDVKRWIVRHENLYLITFPHGFHTKLKDYPAILKHLSQFEVALKKRGQCTSSRGNKEGGQHHWIELDNNPKPEFLAAFEMPKILIPAITPRPHAVADRTGFYSNNKASICVSECAEFLAAIVNSSVSFWFATQVFATKQNNSYDCEPRYSRQIPIPPATDEDKARLTTLAERAAEFAKSGATEALRATEREIDGIVHQLFHLTPAEIALIEEAVGTPQTVGRHGEPDKKEALFRKIRGLGEKHPYVSFEAIKKHARETWPDLKDDTLRQYLSEAAEQGFLFDAGKGWYSSLSNPAVLPAEPVQKWIDLVSGAFPLLEFTCWATVYWNPWLRHLVNRSTVFLQSDSVNLPSVHEFLVTKGIDSRLNPTAVEIAKNPLGPDTIVLRPRPKAAPGEGPVAPVEQFLVDSWVENKAFNLFDSKELKESMVRLIHGERVRFSSLLSYLKYRLPKNDELLAELSIISEIK